MDISITSVLKMQCVIPLMNPLFVFLVFCFGFGYIHLDYLEIHLLNIYTLPLLF